MSDELRNTYDDDILREFYVHSDPAMAIGVCHEKAFFNGFSCNIGEYIAISYVLGNLFLALFHIVLFHLGKETTFYGQKLNFNCDGKYRLGWQMSMSCRKSLPFGGKYCSKNRFGENCQKI